MYDIDRGNKRRYLPHIEIRNPIHNLLYYISTLITIPTINIFSNL